MDKTDARREYLRSLALLSRDAMLGIEGDAILFANDGARALFGSDCEGCAAADRLPPEVLSAGEASFACSLPWQGRSLLISGARQGTLLLLSCREEAPSFPLPGSVLTQLRAVAHDLRLAAERQPLNSGDTASLLYHSCYSLTRLAQHLTDADLLSGDALPMRAQPLDLLSLCRDLIDSIRPLLDDSAPELVFRAEDGKYCVEGDRPLLEKLLLNLLTNALAHTPSGGRICVSLRGDSRAVTLGVEDTGSGIDEGQYASLFTPGSEQTGGALGAGLGLYLAAGIARLHGGTLLLTGREGGGTAVRLRLPASRKLILRDAGERAGGASLLLTELAPVLRYRVYTRRYMD